MGAKQQLRDAVIMLESAKLMAETAAMMMKEARKNKSIATSMLRHSGNELTAAETFLKKSIARGQGNEDSEDEDDEPANDELSNTQLKAVTAIDATIPNKRGSFSECCTYNEKYHVEVDQDWTEKQLRAATASTTDNTQEEGSKSTHKGQRKGSLIRRLLKKKKSRRHDNDDGENDANEQEELTDKQLNTVPAVAGTTTPNKRGSFSECATYNEKYHVEVDQEWVQKQLRDVAANTTTADNKPVEGSKSQPAEDEWTEEQLEALAGGHCTIDDFEPQQEKEEEGWTKEQLEAMKPKGSARQARKGSLTCTYSGQYGKNEDEEEEPQPAGDEWTEEQLEALASGQCTMNDFEQQQEEEEGWTEEQLEAMKPKGSARQARKGSLTCTYTGQYTHNEQEQPEEEEEDSWTEEQLEALASGQCTTNDFEQQQDEGWTEEQLEAMKPKGFRQTEKILNSTPNC